MNRKSSDQWTVPLCVTHHDPNSRDSIHFKGDEDAFFSASGIDARAVARALWAARGDPEAMLRVIFRARQQARLVSP